MKLNIILTLLLLNTTWELRAQTSLDDYRQEVIDFSHEVHISALNSEASKADMRQANKGYLPALSMGAEVNLDFRETTPERPWSWLADVTLSQTIYNGGAVRATAKRRAALYAKSEAEEQLTHMDVIYSADRAYWQLSRTESHLRTMQEYVAVVDSLREVVKRRFEEGYSAKGDLLQIESRISDARYQLSTAEQSYRIALHAYNSLRGTEIDSPVVLQESIFDIAAMPRRQEVNDIMQHHPQYRSTLLSVEESAWAIKSSVARFLPSVHLSIYGRLQPNTPHIRGHGSDINGGAIITFSTPIFHFGERREAAQSAEVKHLQQIALKEQVEDDIELIEGDAWVNIYNARQRVDVARESLSIAEENLAMSIYSYGEGMATILDVLQAQLSWLQISQNAIAAYYDYAMAIAGYEYATATNIE